MNFGDLDLPLLRRFQIINKWEILQLKKRKNGFSEKQHKILIREKQLLQLTIDAKEHEEYQQRDIYSLLD